MSQAIDPQTKEALFEYLCRLGDDRVVMGQRLAEWCGHGPILEEDIALTNISLDCIGQAEILLCLAGEVEGEGRDADALAYYRDELQYRNLQLLEQPRGDFAETIVRQFLYDAYAWLVVKALCDSKWQPLADYAAKAIKEITYHLRHSRQWMLRLGDGTAESHQRVQQAINQYWYLTGELFYTDKSDEHLMSLAFVPDNRAFKADWQELVKDTLAEATLAMPEDPAYMPCLARQGQHSEHLGHLLANMQILARSHPGASW